jgi:hypothetical protein
MCLGDTRRMSDKLHVQSFAKMRRAALTAALGLLPTYLAFSRSAEGRPDPDDVVHPTLSTLPPARLELCGCRVQETLQRRDIGTVSTCCRHVCTPLWCSWFRWSPGHVRCRLLDTVAVLLVQVLCLCHGASPCCGQD